MQAFELPATVLPDGTLELPRLPMDTVSPSAIIKVIVLVKEGPDAIHQADPLADPEDEQNLPTAVESFRQGWADVINGRTIPVSQLWDGIHDD